MQWWPSWISDQQTWQNELMPTYIGSCLLSKKLFLFFIIINDNWCHLVAKAQMGFVKVNYVWHEYFYIQSNLSYVTFQGNSEMWSHKTRFFLSVVSDSLKVFFFVFLFSLFHCFFFSLLCTSISPLSSSIYLKIFTFIYIQNNIVFL